MEQSQATYAIAEVRAGKALPTCVASPDALSVSPERTDRVGGDGATAPASAAPATAAATNATDPRSAEGPPKGAPGPPPAAGGCCGADLECPAASGCTLASDSIPIVQSCRSLLGDASVHARARNWDRDCVASPSRSVSSHTCTPAQTKSERQSLSNDDYPPPTCTALVLDARPLSGSPIRLDSCDSCGLDCKEHHDGGDDGCRIALPPSPQLSISDSLLPSSPPSLYHRPWSPSAVLGSPLAATWSPWTSSPTPLLPAVPSLASLAALALPPPLSPEDSDSPLSAFSIIMPLADGSTPRPPPNSPAIRPADLSSSLEKAKGCAPVEIHPASSTAPSSASSSAPSSPRSPRSLPTRSTSRETAATSFTDSPVLGKPAPPSPPLPTRSPRQCAACSVCGSPAAVFTGPAAPAEPLDLDGAGDAAGVGPVIPNLNPQAGAGACSKDDPKVDAGADTGSDSGAATDSDAGAGPDAHAAANANATTDGDVDDDADAGADDEARSIPALLAPHLDKPYGQYLARTYAMRSEKLGLGHAAALTALSDQHAQLMAVLDGGGGQGRSQVRDTLRAAESARYARAVAAETARLERRLGALEHSARALIRRWLGVIDDLEAFFPEESLDSADDSSDVGDGDKVAERRWASLPTAV